MLSERKPDIKWYVPGGLEEMFFCLFQCEREGEDPEDSLRQHRVPLVRKILADERLKDCFGYVSLEETEHMPYAELRQHAIILERRILKWMDGRIYDRRDLRKPRKGVKISLSIRPGKKKIVEPPAKPTKRELESMHSKLRSFLSFEEEGCELSRQTFDLLRSEAWHIVSDGRFRKFRWHTTSTVKLCLGLSERAASALESLGKMLQSLKSRRKKRTKGRRNGGKPLTAVKGKTSNRSNGSHANEIRTAGIHEGR